MRKVCQKLATFVCNLKKLKATTKYSFLVINFFDLLGNVPKKLFLCNLWRNVSIIQEDITNRPKIYSSGMAKQFFHVSPPCCVLLSGAQKAKQEYSLLIKRSRELLQMSQLGKGPFTPVIFNVKSFC